MAKNDNSNTGSTLRIPTPYVLIPRTRLDLLIGLAESLTGHLADLAYEAENGEYVSDKSLWLAAKGADCIEILLSEVLTVADAGGLEEADHGQHLQ